MDKLTHEGDVAALADKILDDIQAYNDRNMARPRHVACVAIESLYIAMAVVLAAFPRKTREKMTREAMPVILEAAYNTGGKNGVIDGLSGKAANDG